MVMVVMGDMCIQRITAICTYYCQQPMLVTVLYNLRLFVVVGGEHIAMTMAVLGHVNKQHYLLVKPT